MEPNDQNNQDIENNGVSEEITFPGKKPEKTKRFDFANMDKKQKIKVIGLGVLAALLIFSGIVLVLNKTGRLSLRPLSGDSGRWNEGGDRVMNPLTGEMYFPERTGEWLALRPLSVMVNNHTDARPQSGLIYADMTYEIIAEGGITRLLPFYLSHTPEKIGPVRSTRDYYLVLVKELGDAMIMHIGWSPQALTAIESWPVRSLGRGGGNFWRDTSMNVPSEHTAFTNGRELRNVAEDLGWGGERVFEVWEFKDDLKGYDNAPAATDIAIDFWTRGPYSAAFRYDEVDNTYSRFMGFDAAGNPLPHVDRDTGDQIVVKNLVVQFASEKGIAGDDAGRLEYQLIGSGTGLVFIDGKVIEATWSKASRDARTKFYDFNGQEIEFNRGKFWVAVVPDRNVNQVVYQ
jgi:hypothetical protein